MAFDSCNFREYTKITCGGSRGLHELKKLSDCLDEITAHLQSCNLTRSSELTEAKLILARAGHFDLTEEQVEYMFICPQHRHNLGRFWRAPRSCQHSGPRKKQCKDKHVIGVVTAKEIHTICKTTIGIGSRM